jgi:hypothetical protein
MSFSEKPFYSLSLEPYLEALNDRFEDAYFSKDDDGDINALLIRNDNRFLEVATSGSKILFWTGSDYFGYGSRPAFTQKGKYTQNTCIIVGLEFHEDDTVEKVLHQVRSWILNKIEN